ncbi:MAG: ATP-binding protein [bacterium]|nr:ATP-binding protein [bacterium]MCM1375082.1 ATP-binding protein [Muribaculum sp.]
MEDKVIKDITYVLETNKEKIPEGYKLWETWKLGNSKSLEELIQLLRDIFREEEKAIEYEHKKPYVTDVYEDGVRHFAIDLLRVMLNNHTVLDEIDIYVELLGQKHMAYAFYHMSNEDSIDTRKMQKNSRYLEALYNGLVNFYCDFRGRFADNEEAICLLCKYYPKEEGSWLRREKVISALLKHIKFAGAYNDYGYAFHGIEQIYKNIDKLPNDLICELLKQYALYDVVNQKVYRHQIFAIIDGSKMEERDKRKLKFFYLDSLLLANIYNMAWVAQAEENGERIEVHYNMYDEKLDKLQIQVFKNPDAYWDNDTGDKRLFWVNGKQMAEIILEDEAIVFSVQDKKDYFVFKYDDWKLESIQTKESMEIIRKLISDSENFRSEDKQMTFSLLYLDNYRGMQGQILDFDHKYAFSPERGELRRNERMGMPGLYFYGKEIYSLSCIVGKNGTGKTSIIDFLRDTFYKMLKILEDFNVPCENGYIETDSFQEYGILDRELELKFLVVFRIGKEFYFLTNIDGVNAQGILPYRKGICRYLDFCKVVYFSQQMRADQIILFENGERTDRQRQQGIAKTLEGLGQCDFSEMKSFVQKRNALAILQSQKDIVSKETEQMINKELCYQFSLLRNVETGKICDYLDIQPEKEISIYDLESGNIWERFLIKDCGDISKLKEIEKTYDKRLDVGIGFFSSGQYAKLMFLAKLHWFLAGYNKDKEYYESILGGTFFSREEALQKEESALIFIDEGELYYHPEWQRRFLKTLLDVLSLCNGEAKLQVAFTTNSPFVISDLLKEDVQYLCIQEKDFGCTLGQNIHTLLRSNFFLEYTIGEYSRELIEAIMIWLGGGKSNLQIFYDIMQDEEDLYKNVEFIIQQIGEPIYREKLGKMLEERIAAHGTQIERRIRELESQKAELEKELVQLKGEKNAKN